MDSQQKKQTLSLLDKLRPPGAALAGEISPDETEEERRAREAAEAAGLPPPPPGSLGKVNKPAKKKKKPGEEEDPTEWVQGGEPVPVTGSY